MQQLLQQGKQWLQQQQATVTDGYKQKRRPNSKKCFCIKPKIMARFEYLV